VISQPLIAIAIPMIASHRNTSQIRPSNPIWFRDEPYQALIRVDWGVLLLVDDRAFLNDRIFPAGRLD
jgi:hypothetical protein